MRLLRMCGVGVVAAGLVLVTTVPVQAQVQGHGAIASGEVGSVNAWVSNQTVEVAPLALCSTAGSVQGASEIAEVAGFVKFGLGRSNCNLDAASGSASVRVSGASFRFDGLKKYGGPTIKMGGFTADCSTTATGSGSTIKLNAVTGLQLPNPIPTNHVVTIPGATPEDPPIATVTINEMITPEPPDGSMTVNALHIRLFPEGIALDSGDIVVGTVRCSPRG